LAKRTAIELLGCHHPLVVEGMGGYDPRDPAPVASAIVRQLQVRWSADPPPKPIMLVTQGDPYEERGISAITRLVADGLGISRALIFLDPSIADYHTLNADRYKVICEIAFSTMVDALNAAMPDAITSIQALVNRQLTAKNAQRAAAGKQALQDYYRDFALLQEVTKVGCKRICGGVTVAHTSSEIDDFSVSSFYRVGLNLGLIESSEMVPFNA